MMKFYYPRRTIFSKYQKKDGSLSKLEEWGFIEGVPALQMGEDENNIFLNPFTSGSDKIFPWPKDNMSEFVECPVMGEMIQTPSYPGGGFHKKEFEYREHPKELVSKIKGFAESLPSDDKVKVILNAKLEQLISSQGSSCPTIPKIKKCEEEIKNDNVGIKRFDNQIFNRNCRHCPPIDKTFEEYQKSRSYPRPIGIRPKDFCMPSQLVSTIKELIRQIACFKNINPETKRGLLTTIGIDCEQCIEFHKCKWCGEEIDANDFSSTYASVNNFIEICHRDPNKNYIPENMYWGHGECNREQGGWSETDRISQCIRLLQTNEHHMNLMYHQNIIDDLYKKTRLAVINYEKFHSMESDSADIKDIRESSAGIDGWSQMN